jgi:carbon-monoxide dehydrogenase medium subunit
MYEFDYAAPASLEEVRAALASDDEGKLLAGGMSLLSAMKLRLNRPARLVDLRKVPQLRGVRREGAELVVGAMARHVEVANDPLVNEAVPALAVLAGGIGDRQVRAMGTIGGSVANNDPAACYPSAVLGAGATVITSKREIAADDFFLGLFTTALEEDELITAIRFPIPKRAVYEKLRQKASNFPLVGVFLAQFDSGVRVAITGAGNGVFRHAGLEDALNKSFTAAAAAAVKIDASDLNSDLHATAAYRANLISVLTQRAVTRALG